MKDIDAEFVHLARLVLEGKLDDVAALSRRSLRDISERRPDLASEARRVMSLAAGTPLRSIGASSAVPVDADSRLELLRCEDSPKIAIEPIWPNPVRSQLEAVVSERRSQDQLRSAGLAPSRSLLFVGPPGVGKTLAARWLARELGRPLMTLDLSAVMSSFLGKTGHNIRVVLDYAQRTPSALLLDEFDAIAKRRDDVAEIGELKRLVTVLVQSVDEWPADGLLIAATNHPELLDPAVWRRFDRVVEFPMPTRDEIARTVALIAGQLDESKTSACVQLMPSLFQGRSFADVTREVLRMRRSAVLEGIEIEEALLNLAAEWARTAPVSTKVAVARELASHGHSQRSVAELTGLSRDTIRKHFRGRSRDRSRRNRGTQ